MKYIAPFLDCYGKRDPEKFWCLIVTLNSCPSSFYISLGKTKKEAERKKELLFRRVGKKTFKTPWFKKERKKERF